jgi:hypothetical protein
LDHADQWIAEIAAPLSLLGARRFGRYFGIAVGAVAALGALLEILAYPLWSLSVLALDILALYGLCCIREPNLQRELKRHSNRLKTEPVFFCSNNRAAASADEERAAADLQRIIELLKPGRSVVQGDWQTS